ncbi:DUF1566 domain-containing protein [Sulfurovum sp. zt1-1]|uniref:DUF1566 domain-containing protein n=1 Tax=Sulfurovum zhangzhouensis TaxID=3019067 RepID=A0ABT7R028_9BACT|nr:DUF1566 domain-containing protein [Sulfurovum zhangzhouensis]MDM5272425.1 DUF1566 domain-containing protein [Sulfurovum zhangzhouensis]
MRRIFISSALLSAALLMAGGKITPEDIPELVPAVEAPTSDCSKNTVYTDTETHLMWQDEAYTDAEDGAFKNNGIIGKAGNFQHAAGYCDGLFYAGHSDWRLPTSDELMELHRKPGQVFTNFRGEDFWTSTPAEMGKYYVVYPADAYRYEKKANESNYIRCVRCIKEN